jgi:exodeoxyribonuclease V alpha subunit
MFSPWNKISPFLALTRAKELVVLVGQEKYLEEMIENNRINKRFSSLDQRLRAAAEGL